MEEKKIKVSVVKLETVNGKRVGRSYSFVADMKTYGALQSEAQVMEQVRKDVQKGGVFTRAEQDDLKYDTHELLAEWKKVHADNGNKEQKRLEWLSTSQRVTPGRIDRLKEHEIFVFGSNTYGAHGAGAAAFAVAHFGAIMGQGHGLQGQSYAIDTMSGGEVMEKEIQAFAKFAAEHKDLKFYMTAIGTGIAGYPTEYVAKMMECLKGLTNVALPAAFWNVIGIPEEIEKNSTDYNLQRFLEAQENSYQQALGEIQAGCKRSHWIWYIFPQIDGLGRSSTCRLYSISCADEARAYLAHPILAARLREISAALLTHRGRRMAEQIFGELDAMKVRSSMTLFDYVCPGDIFTEVLDAFYDGERCRRTMGMLNC